MCALFPDVPDSHEPETEQPRALHQQTGQSLGSLSAFTNDPNEKS